ncbi:hypothetical protein EDD22DRAFT_852995, partial [Suillus occidentalis]
MSDKDFNAPPFLPPVIQHLSFYVNHAKARSKPYNKNGPSMCALHFAESSVTPHSDLSLMDVQKGKHQLQLGLSDLSSEAIAQAVLTKEADVEYRHLSAMAMAWLLTNMSAHLQKISRPWFQYLLPPGRRNLKITEDFSVAAYSRDAVSFAAADEQLNHLEMLAWDHYDSGRDIISEEETELVTESDRSSMGPNKTPWWNLDIVLMNLLVVTMECSVIAMAYEQQDWSVNVGSNRGGDFQGQLEGSDSGPAHPTTHFNQELFSLRTQTAYQQGHAFGHSNDLPCQHISLTDPSTSTGGALSSLNVQEPPQPRVNLSLFHPQPLDHTSLDQQNLWMLGAHSSEDEFQPHSPGFMAAFEEQMNQGFRRVSPVHSLNATDRIEFLGTRPIVLLFQPLTRMFLLVYTIEEVKVHTHDNMIRSIINTSFFPTNEAVLYTMAQCALDDAISPFSNAELVKWKSRTEGQEEIQRLSEALNRMRDEFKDLSLSSVITAYSLSLPVHLRDQALTETWIAKIKDLLNTGLFIHGKMELIGQDGLLGSIYIPFSNTGIWDLLEIMLSERRYNRFICYDGSDRWKIRLKNVIAFLCTARMWALSQYSTGKLVPSKFMTMANAHFNDNLLIAMSQLDSNGLFYFDALLTDLHNCFPLFPSVGFQFPDFTGKCWLSGWMDPQSDRPLIKTKARSLMVIFGVFVTLRTQAVDILPCRRLQDQGMIVEFEVISNLWIINPHRDNPNLRDVDRPRVYQIMQLLPCTKYTQAIFVDSLKDRKGRREAMDKVTMQSPTSFTDVFDEDELEYIMIMVNSALSARRVSVHIYHDHIMTSSILASQKRAQRARDAALANLVPKYQETHH